MSNESKYPLDKTDQIKQGDAEVGPMVKGAIAIITLICISYLIINI
jgi:hypothetical protein